MRSEYLKTRLRELAVRSGRVVEFSVAWARLLKGLSPEARRRLGALSPQTRQTGGKLGQGADFRVYESFTPGRGRTATKTLVPDALKERDQVMAAVKKSWGDVEASPAGKFAALPVGWHKAGYVQDRMVEVGRKPRFRRRIVKDSFLAKVSPFPMNPNSEWAQMPKGALDSGLAVRTQGPTGRVKIHVQNIMLDPRKRRLVLTDPLGWQSSSTQIGALTPGPAVR